MSEPAADGEHGGPSSVTPRALRWAALATALLPTVVAFLPTLRFAFVNWDDDIHVYRNPLLAPDAPWLELARTRALGYPIPVTIATYKLEWALFGAYPAVFHATNVALHACSVALVFSLALALRLRPAAAALAAALFGLCPVVAEPVSWVTGRKDLLATMLLLAALRVHIAGAEPATPRPWARGTAVALSLLAMLSKPSAICAPLLVLAHESLYAARPWRESARRAAPYALVTAPVAVVSFLGQRAVHAVAVPRAATVVLRQAWYALGYHLGLLFGLQPSCMKHIPREMPPRFDPRVDLVPVAFFALTCALYRATPDAARPRARFALAFALAAYLPASSLLPLTRYLAETYTYLPLVGLALFAAGLFDVALARRARTRGPEPLWIALAAPLACALALLPATLAASAKWRDGVALWSQAYRRYPDSPQVCRGLGNAYFYQGAPAAALHQYERCAAAFGPEMFRHNQAVTLRALGRVTEAAALEPTPRGAP